VADISASNWDESDAANTTAAPDGAPEGMAPSGVNNVLRAHQGAIKRWYDWTIPKTTGGSSVAFTLSYTVTPGALVDGMTHLVEFDQANIAAPTLNVNALGAIPLRYYSAGAWRAVPAALWAANAVFRIAYHSSSGTYRILGLPDRTGEVVPFAGSTAPAGSLLCYGQAVSRTDYVGLFTAISTTHGAGDGSTTFNVPDMRSRAAAGKSDMGGSSNGLLTGGTVLGAALGAQTATTGGPSATTAVESTAPTQNAADIGHTHSASTVQPTIILNYLIRI
jgi:hypothetical protein